MFFNVFICFRLLGVGRLLRIIVVEFRMYFFFGKERVFRFCFVAVVRFGVVVDAYCLMEVWLFF